MRWYRIIVGNQTWDATGDPYALNVELDITVKPYHVPTGSSFVRVWGIPRQLLLNARQFNNQPIQVYGGMQKGLPLANPGQQGMLAKGKVLPCVGNWVGTDQTIDFFMVPGGGESNPGKPANVVHNWPANTPLAGPLKQTLQAAYPGYNIIMKISDKLKLPNDERGFYQSIGQYAPHIFGISQNILGGSIKNYMGVHITFDKNNIVVHDGTQQPSQAGVVNFQDLIGMPVWINVNTIQIKCVLRGDLEIDHKITLPKTIALQSYNAALASAASSDNSTTSTIIQGDFRIIGIRHVGNFRQPDWPSWCTIVDAQVINSPGGGTTGPVSAAGGGGGDIGGIPQQ